MLVAILVPHARGDVRPAAGVAADRVGAQPAILALSGLRAGLAIKVPLFLFHTWLPDAHVAADCRLGHPGGVLLKMGTYVRTLRLSRSSRTCQQ